MLIKNSTCRLADEHRTKNTAICNTCALWHACLPTRSKVESKAEQGKVVRVQNTVTKAHRLPSGYHSSCCLHATGVIVPAWRFVGRASCLTQSPIHQLSNVHATGAILSTKCCLSENIGHTPQSTIPHRRKQQCVLTRHGRVATGLGHMYTALDGVSSIPAQ